MPARLFALAAAVFAVPLVAAQIPVEMLYTAETSDGINSNFGTSLSPFPDVDADGTPDLLVGAFSETVIGREFAGRAYLVSGATGTILQTFDARGDINSGAAFGWSLAHAGDLDGDGTPDLVVGANLYLLREDEFEGRVYLVSGATGDVLHVVVATDVEGYLGDSVVGVGDLDGDGVPDVAAGQPGDNSVVVASGATGAVLRLLRVAENHTTLGDAMVAVSDLTGDGVPEIAVGAPTAPGNAGGGGLGRVYVLDPVTGTLVVTLANPTGVPIQQFGDRRTVAAVGDLDGDGVIDVAVGAPNGQRPDGLYGYVHLFSGATGSLLRSCVEPAALGIVVAAAGDLDGDGVPDVLTSGGGSGPANGVVALSGASCEVLLSIPSPFVTALGFPAAIAAIRPGGGGEPALLAIGAAGSLPGESEIVSRVFVYRVGGIVAASPSPAMPGVSVSVAPNPSAGTAWAMVSVSVAASVRVTVTDAAGRVVAVLHDGPASSGAVRLALPAGLAAGVYAVVAEGAGTAASARWVVAR